MATSFTINKIALYGIVSTVFHVTLGLLGVSI